MWIHFAQSGDHDCLTSFVVTGFGQLDRAHRDLEGCLRGLAETVRARDASDARRRACLLVEMLAQHFGDEEEIMRVTDYPLISPHKECHERLLSEARRFERDLARSSLTPALTSLALLHLPELIRYHMITTDFGMAKHVLRVTHDSRPRLARRRVPSVRPG